MKCKFGNHSYEYAGDGIQLEVADEPSYTLRCTKCDDEIYEVYTFSHFENKRGLVLSKEITRKTIVD